ncbi:MAG: hypothetical protein Q9175_006004, partial [Cornicularia normoerica]
MRLFFLSQNLLLSATSPFQHKPDTPSVQPQQQPTTTSSPTFFPPILEPRFIPTPVSFSVDTSTAYDVISGTTYSLTYTDLVYGTVHLPYVQPSTADIATVPASRAASACSTAQSAHSETCSASAGTTGGGNGNVASVTPMSTALEPSLGSVVPKGSATFA